MSENKFIYEKYKIAKLYFLFLPLAQQPHARQGLLILEVPRSHTMTRHIRYASCEWVIGQSQNPLSQNTKHSQEKTSMHPLGLFFVLCTLSVFLCPDCPGFDFCPSVYNTHNTDIHAQVGFEPAIPASDRPQIFALERSATGIDTIVS